MIIHDLPPHLAVVADRFRAVNPKYADADVGVTFVKYADGGGDVCVYYQAPGEPTIVVPYHYSDPAIEGADGEKGAADEIDGLVSCEARLRDLPPLIRARIALQLLDDPEKQRKVEATRISKEHGRYYVRLLDKHGRTLGAKGWHEDAPIEIEAREQVIEARAVLRASMGPQLDSCGRVK